MSWVNSYPDTFLLLLHDIMVATLAADEKNAILRITIESRKDLDAQHSGRCIFFQRLSIQEPMGGGEGGKPTSSRVLLCLVLQEPKHKVIGMAWKR